jgi:predicted RNase H-like nuclease
VIDAGWTVGVPAVAAWVAERADSDTLALVDAPLVVTNASGQRLCEKQVGQRYRRCKVSANSANVASPRLAGVRLRTDLERARFRYDDGLAGPRRSGRHVSECYPCATIVGAAELGYSVRAYKPGPRAVRPAICDQLIRRVAGLRSADPPLDPYSHPVTRRLVDEPTPQGGAAYKHREDLLDAAIAAWTASFWCRYGLERRQVLGDATERPAATIIAPAR